MPETVFPRAKATNTKDPKNVVRTSPRGGQVAGGTGA